MTRGTTTTTTPATTRTTLQRRTVRVLVLSQVLGGVGLAAGVAVGALLAADLLDGDALTGIPSAAATAGSAAAAVPLSRLMARAGRRPGLVAGYLLGASGAAVVLASAQLRSFAALVVGMTLFGAGNAASLLARYAAADLAEPHHRARAVSTVLFATTFGAVAGPNLVEPTGALARAVSLPELAGPFLLSLAAYGLAAAVVGALLRPDPLLVARDGAGPAPVAPTGGAWALVLRGPALAGLAAMVGAQFVMVAMMTMTPVHMLAHGHDLGVIGFVIGVHIAGMFAFAPLAGLLADRFGNRTAIRAGALALAAAGLTGALAAPSSAPVLAVALFLLGLGWSLALVGGSALLTASVPPPQRARAQGSGDLFVGLAGAVGGLGSGVVLALSGFAVLGLLTAAVAAALLAAGPAGHRRPAVPTD